MKVSFVNITANPEQTMAYIARVSNPNNQDNENYAGLLRYCIKHQHWSVFEQSSMTLEIETTRGLAAQVLRHRSFTFQEFSQRYADSNLLGKQMNTLFSSSLALYNQMLQSGVAKECARFVLPLATPTRLYMTGSCRSWIHYIQLRSAHGTQKEHMDIANACKSLFVQYYPTVAEALDWTK